jgi:hypothetical protein
MKRKERDLADDAQETPEMESYATDHPHEEASVPDRLRAVLASIKTNASHNAPIAPADIAELEAIVAASSPPDGSMASPPSEPVPHS